MQCIDVLALSIVSPTRPLSLSLSLRLRDVLETHRGTWHEQKAKVTS